jgi:uncharacterized RDD family membrane protein YckC
MQSNRDFAGFWIRLIAALIDIVVTLPFFAAIIYLFGTNDYTKIKIDEDFYYYTANSVTSKGNHIVDAISWIIAIGYSVFLVSSKSQATIGKRICNIHIATVDGHKLSKLRALARFLVSMVSLLLFGLGFLMVAFTKEKTALHDLVCGTRVFLGKANK